MTIAAAGSAALYAHSDLPPRWLSISAAADSVKQRISLPPIVLYQYEVCPFCCKVRAFLDYHKIPYEVVEVNPITKAELKWSSYKKVPVVKLGDAQINESDLIISALSQELNSKASNGWFSKNSGVAADGTAEEKEWREWVNQRLVRIITANIYRSLGESWQTFDYIVEHGNFGVASRLMTRMFGTATMYVIGRRMPNKYNIDGDLREALYAAADEWMDAVGNKDFLGGKKPNLADLAVYGVIQAVEGTSTYKDMIERTKVEHWLSRMKAEVGQTCRINSAKTEDAPAEAKI